MLLKKKIPYFCRMYNSILKPILFNLPAEEAHKMAMSAANLCQKLPFGDAFLKILAGKTADDSIHLLGLSFRNRIGLAAGFDKDGHYIEVLKNIGFSHIEVGTVTPKPQPGNPRPRLFRLIKDEAIINRMGFNNQGVHQLAERLRQLRDDKPIIGCNIGKNKDTPNDEAWKDYTYCLKALHPYADYFTVNLSSPNTPGLRELQEKDPLIRILSELQNINQTFSTPKPILLKVSPDNEKQVFDDIIQVSGQCGINGLIATNTTVERSGLKTSKSELKAIGAGGLSGKPLTQKSLDIVKYLRTNMPQNMALIGVGGISSHEDFQNMKDAGADLIQIFTSFIYQGLSVVSKIARG